MSSFVGVAIAGVVLALLQVVAALPWMWAVDPKRTNRLLSTPASLGQWLGGVVAAGVFAGLFIGYIRDSQRLEFLGRLYGSVLHAQLAVDLFVGGFALLLALWPKGGAVALSAFREAMRQTTFWLLAIGGFALIWLSVVVPYFTFGDDYKMMKQLAFDIIMLTAVLFCVLAASISINEEIEGRTAITLMSKPVTRRQFLIGKYLGLLAAGWAMTLFLGWWLNWALLVQPTMNKLDEVVDTMPLELSARLTPLFQRPFPVAEAQALAAGAALWFADTFAFTLGLALGFGQVMVLLGIAAALATRLPFVANIMICLVVFLLGRLAPVLVAVTDQLRTPGAPSTGDLVGFVARLIDTILPALEFFNMGPVIIRENPVPVADFAVYVASVLVYAVIYSVIALLIGLILFEDRDLA
jgi:hypothetical protein